MRWCSVASVLGLLLLPARDAAAMCQNGSASQTVSGSNGTMLYNVLAVSTPPCTILVGPGTYTAPTAPPGEFTISSGITVRSTNGAGATTLSASNYAAVAIWPIAGSCPSNATLDGFTLLSPGGGVFVGAGDDIGHPGCALNQITGVTLRNLVVNAPNGGHGLDFHRVQNSMIDSCTVVNAFGHGILIETGSNNNIVMNNTVQQAYNAIGVQSSSDNVIVGNTITNSAAGGITLVSLAGRAGPGSSRNRIERNTLADGITIADYSLFNYIGLNKTVAPAARTFGVGVWVVNASDGSYVFGNDASGWKENGMDVMTSSSTLLVGNTVHANAQGGIWVVDDREETIDPAAPPPRNTVLQGNNIFYNISSANIFLQGAHNSQIAFNYLSAAADTHSGVLASPSSVAVQLQASSANTIFENIVSEVGSRAFVFANTLATVFYRNAFLRGTNDPSATNGLNGLTYSFVPADVQWDGGSFLGGNHWSEYTAATANPDPSHPYTAFIGNTNGGPYVDRFPYGSESRQTPTIPNSVTVVEPVAGSVLAAGTTRTIHWVARGCSLVDLYYQFGGAGPALIVSGHPNIGYYFWTVPPVLAPRADYTIQAVCTNRDGGSLGVVGTSPPFTVASSDLVLLNPGRATRATDNSVLRVAWKASPAVGGVNVYVKSSVGVETQVASNVTGTSFVDVTLPASVSSSSHVSLRIQDAGNASRQDSVDGYFMVRGTTPSFASNLSQKLQVGSVRILDWNGMASSFTVDLDLVGDTTTAIARNLPDFGSFTWLVPDAETANARIHATFKDANGNQVGFTDSGTFGVARSGVPTGLSRTAAPRTDFDGDARSDLAVFRPSNGTWYLRYSSLGYSVASHDEVQWALPNDVPIAGDFDGDGRTDLTVFRPSTGTWYIRYSSLSYSQAAYQQFQWGLPGDVPIAGDFDGDGRTDLTVFRPSNGTWYIRYSSLGYSVAQHAEFQWALPGDVPIAGDFDGDGRTDLTVFRPSNGTWFVRFSSLGYSQAAYQPFQWGLPGDVPIAGDFDGDQRTDVAIYRPSDGGWYILYSSRGYSAPAYGYFQWGLPGDVPLIGDFDGDGRTELTIFRPSTGEWFTRYSSTAYATYNSYQWGLPQDVPIK